MPQPEPLHPNLARLAAAYDLIYERWSRREIEPNEARGQILALVTRDDHGVQWRIHPDTGAWQRQTFNCQWVDGTPPTFGLATPTAHDLSGGTAINPDSRLSMHAVDESILYGPQSLAGSTRRPAPGDTGTGLAVLVAKVGRTRLIAAGAVLAVLVAIFNIAGGHHSAPAAPSGHHPATTSPAGPLGGQ